MSVFSILSGSKKQAQKLRDEKEQKQKANAEPKPKYMHKPKHAYVDALNSTTGASPVNNREHLREAAERRKSRVSLNSSYTSMSGLRTANSSSAAITTMSSWEARKAMAHKDQLQKAAGPIATTSGRKSYQSSPLASVAASTAGPSTASSYDRLEMAGLTPAPLRPSLSKTGSSQKKSVTIQIPAHGEHEQAPPSPPWEDPAETPLIAIVEPAHIPIKKTITIEATEVPSDISSEEEKDKTVIKKPKKKISLFWKKRAVPMAATAA